jgi:hypothetical protein
LNLRCGSGTAREPRLVVVDEEHGPAGGDALPDGGVEFRARRLVEAGPRFVEDEQAGGGEPRLGDGRYSRQENGRPPGNRSGT